MHRHPTQQYIYHQQQHSQQLQSPHSSQTWPFDSAPRHRLQQVHEVPVDSRTSQDQWTKKRTMFGDDDDDLELSFKKRYKGTQASSQGSFGWSGLLESVASGAEHDIPRASTLSEQSHFEQIISPQYDPSTPPLETGPFQANASHFNFQPTDGSMLRNVIESRELNLDIGLEHSHEGVSIRPLSPAPSSPSESIEDIERSDTSLRQNLNNTVIDKRVSVGRSSFTMGYKPGCERCLRREKGHFAHFG